MQINNTSIQIVRGSVLEQDVEAIVNAANTMMRGGGGVDGAIHQAAGPKLLLELQRVSPKGAATGSVIVTQGHQLKQRFILHTPGPIYRNYAPEEAARLLSQCYRGCLDASEELQLSSVAFCSISTGVYGYPLEEAAPLAIETVCKYLQDNPSTSLKRIIFAMFGRAEFEQFQDALQVLAADNSRRNQIGNDAERERYDNRSESER